MKCTALAEGITIRVAPMEKSRGGWDEEHFHERLRVPEGSVVGRGMVVMLEGESQDWQSVNARVSSHGMMTYSALVN